MTAPWFTGSSYGKARKCPGSVVLPQVRHEGPDRMGRAIHRHLALRVTHGLDYALEQLDVLARECELDPTEAGILRSRCYGFEFTPPAGALVEVPLGLFANGSVRVVEGGEGRYDLPEGGVFALTVDAVWSEPEPLQVVDGRPVCPRGSELHVLDYKTGLPVYTDAIESNHQLAAAALLCAIWTGATRVIPAICYVRKGEGTWDVPDHWLGVEQLAKVGGELHETIVRVQRQRGLLDDGAALDELLEGAHCEFCDAQSRCPAKTTALARLVGGAELLGDAPLTEEQLARLVGFAPQLTRMADRINAAARAHVQATGAPIDLGGGRLWGPHPHTTSELVPAAAFPVLAELVGVPRAQAALTITLSRKAVTTAVRAMLEEQGVETDGEVARQVRRFFAQVIEAGGLAEHSETWWSTYRGDGAPIPPPRVRKPRGGRKGPRKAPRAALPAPTPAPRAPEGPPVASGAPEAPTGAPEAPRAPPPVPEAPRAPRKPTAPPGGSLDTQPPRSPFGAGRAWITPRTTNHETEEEA